MDNSCVFLLLFTHRTPGFHRWTSSGTRGSVVFGQSIKKRIFRCLNLRYTLRATIDSGAVKKLQTHPPSQANHVWDTEWKCDRRSMKPVKDETHTPLIHLWSFCWCWCVCWQVSQRQRVHSICQTLTLTLSPPFSRSMSFILVLCLPRRWHLPGWTTISGKDFLRTCARSSGSSSRWRSCTIRRTRSTWGLLKLFLRAWKLPNQLFSRSTTHLLWETLSTWSWTQKVNTVIHSFREHRLGALSPVPVTDGASSLLQELRLTAHESVCLLSMTDRAPVFFSTCTCSAK